MKGVLQWKTFLVLVASTLSHLKKVRQKCFCSFKIAHEGSFPCSRIHQVKNNEMNWHSNLLKASLVETHVWIMHVSLCTCNTILAKRLFLCDQTTDVHMGAALGGPNPKQIESSYYVSNLLVERPWSCVRKYSTCNASAGSKSYIQLYNFSDGISGEK